MGQILLQSSVAGRAGTQRLSGSWLLEQVPQASQAVQSNPGLCLSPGPGLFQELGRWREGKAIGDVGSALETPAAAAGPGPASSHSLSFSGLNQRFLKGSCD